MIRAIPFVFRAAVIELLGVAAVIWLLSSSPNANITHFSDKLVLREVQEKIGWTFQQVRQAVELPNSAERAAYVEKTLDDSANRFGSTATRLMDISVDDLLAQIKSSQESSTLKRNASANDRVVDFR